MRPLSLILSAFCLAAVSIAFTDAHAESAVFKTNVGIFCNSPELIENDRGLLCVGFDAKDCAQAEFRAVAAAGSTEGSFSYDIEYSIKGTTCRAYLGKSFVPGMGWATTNFKSALICR